MAQIYNIISIVAFALAGFFFLLSIFFWFYFRILKIINDLSGRSARKAIEARRRENEKAGSKVRQPSMGVGNRGTPASPSGQGGAGIGGAQQGGTSDAGNGYGSGIKSQPPGETVSPDAWAGDTRYPGAYAGTEGKTAAGDVRYESTAGETLPLGTQTEANRISAASSNGAAAGRYQDPFADAGENDTGLLTEETGLLDGGETGRLAGSAVRPEKFYMLQDIMLIHTDEVI